MDFSQCFHEWQTFVASIFALLAGLGTILLGSLTIKAMDDQRKSQEKIAQIQNQRLHQSYRASLPLVLHNVTSHLIKTCMTIKAAEKHINDREFDTTVDFPTLPHRDIAAIERFLSTCDDRNVVAVMSLCINRIQILTARMSVLNSYPKLDPRDWSPATLDDWFILCAEAHACSEALFNYSHFQTNTGPDNITWERVENFIKRNDGMTPKLAASIRMQVATSPYFWTAQ